MGRILAYGKEKKKEKSFSLATVDRVSPWVGGGERGEFVWSISFAQKKAFFGHMENISFISGAAQKKFFDYNPITLLGNRIM